MEQVKGIEPSYSAWEADVLPLNYTCKGAPDIGLKNYSTKSKELQVYFFLLYISCRGGMRCAI